MEFLRIEEILRGTLRVGGISGGFLCGLDEFLRKSSESGWKNFLRYFSALEEF